MAKKAANKGKQVEGATPVESTAEATQPDGAVAELPRESVLRVNTANLTELKNAVDDHLKLVLSSPQHAFVRSYIHDDVRLALGWTAVGVAAVTGYYSYVVDDFHRTKGWVALGVAVYFALNTVLALYVALVEKNTIYQGKRRTLASRITTERVSLSSVAYSSPTHHTTSSWVPFPLSLLLRTPAPPAANGSVAASSSSTSSSPLSTDPSDYPLYRLTLSYSHSANANKSLLALSTLVLEKPFGEMFDENGTIAVRVVEDWVMGNEGLGKVVKGGGGANAVDSVGK